MDVLALAIIIQAAVSSVFVRDHFQLFVLCSAEYRVFIGMKEYVLR